MTVEASVRSMVVAELLEIAGMRDGAVPTQLVEYLSADYSVGQSTIWRWVSDGREERGVPARRRSHLEALTEYHIEVVFACGGDLKKAKAALDSADDEIAAMSYHTFRRRWLDLDPAVRAAASEGLDGVLDNQMRILYTAEARNDLWHTDHQELPIVVVPVDAPTTRVKPWLTTILDDATRRIMAVSLTVGGRPGSDEVVVCVADAIRRKRLPNGHLVGGIPAVLHSDNGGEFRSNHVTEGLTRLGITARRTFPYLKHQNGKVERVQQTLQKGLIAKLPGYTEAPQFRPLGDLYGADADLIGEMALAELIYEWVDAYNAEHPHSALDGATPNDVWCSQSNELRFPDDEAIRLSMLSTGRTYRVQQAGVHFQNRYYTSPDLARQHLIGRDVEVRYMPRDPSFIEVFVDGNWRATAFPHQSLTDAQKDELKRIVRDQYRTASNYHKQGARRRAIAAQTAPGDLAQIAADPDTLGPDDDAFLDLADAASISQVDQAPAPDPLDVAQNDTDIDGDDS